MTDTTSNDRPLRPFPDDTTIDTCSPTEFAGRVYSNPPEYADRPLTSTDTTIGDLHAYLEASTHPIEIYVRADGDVVGLAAVIGSMSELAELVALVGIHTLTTIEPTQADADDAWVTATFD